MAETFEDDTFIISIIISSFQGDYYGKYLLCRKEIIMTENTILNTDMFTKIVIKNEDDDTVVAVITADDVEPAPHYIAVLTPKYK